MAGVGTSFTGPHGPIRDSAAIAVLRSETASERKVRKFLRDPCVMGGRLPTRQSPRPQRAPGLASTHSQLFVTRSADRFPVPGLRRPGRCWTDRAARLRASARRSRARGRRGRRRVRDPLMFRRAAGGGRRAAESCGRRERPVHRWSGGHPLLSGPLEAPQPLDQFLALLRQRFLAGVKAVSGRSSAGA